MESTGRFFLCGRCRAQVLLCSHCDRCQIYCDPGCSKAARRCSLQAAGRRYQRLAGQAKGYLRVQLPNWKISVRNNSPQGVINRIAGALTEQ